LTYGSRIYANVKQIQQIYVDNTLTESKIIDSEKIYLAKIPIMVGSKICILNQLKNLHFESNECKYDSGGYFIVNGGEKVIIPQERLIDNKIMVLKKKDQSSLISVAEIRSVSNFGISNTISIKLKKDGLLTIISPQFRDKNEIPLIILLKALGLENDKQIIDLISFGTIDTDINYKLLPNLLIDHYYNKNIVRTQEDALRFLVKYVRKIYKNSEDEINENTLNILKNILQNEFMPHINSNLLDKAYFICYMTNRLLNCDLGRLEFDDRDNYINKRLDLPGQLISYIFRQSLKKLIIECGKNFKKKIANDDKFIYDAPSILSFIKPNIIEKDLKSVLLTGSWGLQNIKSRKGVAQVLKKNTYLDYLSYMRRIKSPTGDSTSANKMIEPRLLHNTQYGFICPVETPEGQPVGLVKHLSIASSVTVSMFNQIEIINNIIADDIILLKDIQNINLYNNTKVFINGSLMGCVSDGYKIKNKLRESRFDNTIDKKVSICFNFKLNELRIYTDGGRYYRPLFVVENNKLILTDEIMDDIKKNKLDTFNKILLKYPKIIEFIDIEECHGCLICKRKEDLDEKTTYIKTYTHCEIHPSLILGVVASNIPLCDHNQSPRNTYQCAQARQAMGIFASNYRHRMATLSYILYYPQLPLVTTHGMKYINSQSLPAGQMAVVAIASYSGFNQEDSIIFNQSAIDRGLFRSVFNRKYEDTIRKNPTTSKKDIFTKPNKDTISNMKPYNYNKIQSNGLPLLETYVTGNDIIIGKASPNLSSNKVEKPYFDCSKTIRLNESGIVDKIIRGHNGEDYEIVKINVRSERIPRVGDKFSSRGGQKGTIGITLRQEDMPFADNGVTPDLIINPHAIPSRMTIGQVLECVMGKIGSIEGHTFDGTPFQRVDIKELESRLEKHGYSKDNCETLRCGYSGRKLDCKIFIGPTYYQRLKHMVEDKIHSRSTGPQQILTRQPAEGRSRDGGFRCGEMERDCLIGHGMSSFLRERLLICSDPYKIKVCSNCGIMAQKKLNNDCLICLNCDNTKTIREVELPYAFKLLMQELMSIKIVPKFILD
ncbi:hypothetical protein N9T73_00415, partial [bacterium]|nr:hypothetical protein [bacterium]